MLTLWIWAIRMRTTGMVGLWLSESICLICYAVWGAWWEEGKGWSY